MDLDLVRQDVNNGKTIAQSFAERFSLSHAAKTYLNSNGDDITTDKSLANTITTLRLNSEKAGSLGNSDTISIYQEQLSHYDVDFNKWFSANPDAKIPEDLNGKGFRWYCATDTTEWFNIIFRSDMTNQPPESGNDEVVIKSINIDVSKVTDAKSLVDAIYDQAQPILTGSGKMNHYYRLAESKTPGILTVYDSRAFDVSTLTDLYQKSDNGTWRGARIADGVLDDILMAGKLNSYIRRLIIQDTDKADMNLQIQIPDMRLKSIFTNLDYGKDSIKDYSLVSKDDRSSLLGKPPEYVGILDEGLTYLLDAVVMVGAQRSRLEYDQQNLVTQVENTTASESAIRDADMAKEMTEYTKYNVITQSAQSMLAQANQNGSAVLSLLQ